jgi:D-xylose transport system substrate-binding protein
MGIRKKRNAGSIVCILLTALFSVLAVSGCAKTEDAAAGSVEQEEQEVQIGLSFESFVIERWMRERVRGKGAGGGGQCTECQRGCGGTDFPD